MDKLISQQAAIEALNTQAEEMSHWSERYQEQRRGVLTAVNIVADCPSVQPNHCAEVGKKVLIDRQEALEAIGTLQTYKLFAGDDMILIDKAEVQTELMMLPPTESEPSQVARDIATILENEKDMRVIATQPDIIHCKDCKWCGRADKRRFYRGMDCLKKRINTIVPDRDFCSRAERREDGQTDFTASCD